MSYTVHITNNSDEAAATFSVVNIEDLAAALGVDFIPTNIIIDGVNLLISGTPGSALADGGEVTIRGGEAQNGNGGGASLIGGTSTNGNGGNVSLQGGSDSGAGNTGSVTISGLYVSVSSEGGMDLTGTPVIFAALPTADPSVASQLWNDAGTVKVSAG